MDINWIDGSWETGISEASPTCRITLAADWAPIRQYEPLILEKPLAVYGDLLPILRASDLNIVNVECVLGDVGEPILKAGPALKGKEASVAALTEVPFQVACLANNHSMDFGPASLENTIKVLQEGGIRTVGAGMSGEEAAKPLIIDVKGTSVGILNCAEGEACASVDNGPGVHGFDVTRLGQQIRELKAQVDVVLVVFHGGREHMVVPPVYVVESLRQLANMGANAIIAHHPHMPQPFEIYNGVPIIYSQGNFVFWQGRPLYFLHTGYLVHLDFAGKQLKRVSLTPYRIDEEGLSVLQGADKERLYADLKQGSELLKDPVAVRQIWEAFIDEMGTEGITKELQNHVEQMNAEAAPGAACFLNLFFTPAHRELYLHGLRRISQQEIGNSPEWAKQMIKDWHTRELIDPVTSH